MTTRIQLRRDTAIRWMSINPVLAAGEPAVESDTGKLKVGDGTSAWSALPYILDVSDLQPVIEDLVAAAVPAPYTDEQVRDVMGSAIVGDGDYIAVTASDGANTVRVEPGAAWTELAELVPTLAELLPTKQDIATLGADVAADPTVRAAFGSLLGQPPYHLDAYHGFFTEGWTWVAGQGTAGTTLTAAASAGATTLSVASGAGLINGTVLVTGAGTAQQKQYKVTAGGGTTTLTVTPAIATALANGATVTPLWTDSGHLTNPAGWSALAYFIANAKKDDGTPIIGNPGTKPIVFFGNSWMVPALTAYADAIHARFPAATVQMKGVSGNNSAQLLARFDTDVPFDAAYVIFNEPGVNAAGSGESRATQQANLEALVEKCRAIGAVPIFLGAVPLADFPAQSKAQALALDEAFATPAQFPATGLSALDERFQQKTASGSTAYGVSALAKDTAGSNTAVGQAALAQNVTGSANVAVGQFALSASTGNGNTAVGQGTLQSTTGNENTAVGQTAGQAVTSGANNTAVGSGALMTNASGAHNTAVGRAALKIATGSSNTAMGRDAAAKVTTGSAIVAIGTNAGESPNFVGGNATTTGSNQTLVGAYSGQGSATQVNDITAVGAGARASATGASALGKDAVAGHANSVALGNGTTTTAADQVMVGGRDVELTDATKGVVLKSPDGTRYRITVANGGAISATAI